MALPVQTFRQLDPSETGNNGNFLSQALRNFSTGMNSFQEQQMRQAKMRELIASALSKEAYAKMPFGGKQLPGPAGVSMALETLKQTYGENSPQYRQAVQAYNLGQQSTGSRINYQDRLANTLPVRLLTPQGKSFVEGSNVNHGASPTGSPVGQPVVPGMPAYDPGAPNTPEGDQYDLQRFQRNVPASVKQKLLYASNIEKTLGQINPDDLTQYGGLVGDLKRRWNEKAASVHSESPAYDKYSGSLASANLMSKQIRQFYGDSIQPEVKKDLETLTSPATWSNNPELAKQLFNRFATTMHNEIQTYRDAAKSTRAYSGDKSSVQNLPEGTVEDTRTVNGNDVVKINGKWYHR